MPIQKLKVLSNGLSGNFWKIRGVYLSPDYGNTRAFADLYIDAGHAVSGTPIYSEDIVLENGINPLHPNNLAYLVEHEIITMAGDFLSGTQV